MGIAVMLAAVLAFWKFVSRRAALILMAFLAFGLLAYSTNPDRGHCGDKAWFCAIVADKEPEPAVPEPCPPEEPIAADARIFESDAANAEVHRQIAAGTCQQTAINRVAHGWKAPFDPAYQAAQRKAD
nr:hypothetical protein [uncultured Cupriavidus sp.]